MARNPKLDGEGVVAIVRLMVGEGVGEGDTLGEGEAVRVTVGEALRVPLPDGVGVGEAVSDPLEEEEAVEEEEAEEVEDAEDVAEEDGVSVACRRRPGLHTAAEQRERLSTTRSMTSRAAPPRHLCTESRRAPPAPPTRAHTQGDFSAFSAPILAWRR